MKTPLRLKQILGIALVVALAVLAIVFREWLRDVILLPLVIAWLWLVFYVTHLPQAAVWFAVLALLALAALAPLRAALPKAKDHSPKPLAYKGPRGPVSAWLQTVNLAMRGTLYRRRLFRFFEACVDALEPGGVPEALEDLRPQPTLTQRLSLRESDTFIATLNQVLDELNHGKEQITRP